MRQPLTDWQRERPIEALRKEIEALGIWANRGDCPAYVQDRVARCVHLIHAIEDATNRA